MTTTRPNRRTDDVRIEKIEKQVDKMSEDINIIKVKIFDGYDTSIKSTADKVQWIDRKQTTQHEELREDMKMLSKKLDDTDKKIERLLWKLVGITFFAVITNFIFHAFGLQL